MTTSALPRRIASVPLRLGRRVRLATVPAGVHGALPTGRRHAYWLMLMDHAADADAPEVQALAGVLATAFERHGLQQLPLSGVNAGDTRRLLTRFFPGVEAELALDWSALQLSRWMDPRHDEIEDLVDLLVGPDPGRHHAHDEKHWVAHAVSQATLGQDHLWQDLHLPSRRELTALMDRWFPDVAARNDRHMRWKKFLYKQLCDKAEISICRAPSCSVCSEYAVCFGPEDAVAA